MPLGGLSNVLARKYKGTYFWDRLYIHQAYPWFDSCSFPQHKMLKELTSFTFFSFSRLTAFNGYHTNSKTQLGQNLVLVNWLQVVDGRNIAFQIEREEIQTLGHLLTHSGSSICYFSLLHMIWFRGILKEFYFSTSTIYYFSLKAWMDFNIFSLFLFIYILLFFLRRGYLPQFFGKARNYSIQRHF